MVFGGFASMPGNSAIYLYEFLLASGSSTTVTSFLLHDGAWPNPVSILGVTGLALLLLAVSVAVWQWASLWHRHATDLAPYFSALGPGLHR